MELGCLSTFSPTALKLSVGLVVLHSGLPIHSCAKLYAYSLIVQVTMSSREGQTGQPHGAVAISSRRSPQDILKVP